MGFFSDLFKEKINWSYEELQALWITTSGMAAVDGNVDESETKAIAEVVGNLPGVKVSDWEDFMERASKIHPKEHLKTLAKMHKDKKTYALYALARVAAADDEIDPAELAGLNNLKSILKV